MDKKTLTLLLIVLVDMIGFGIVIPILPLLIENVGGGTFLVGVVIAAFSLVQFIFSPILGRLSDKYGRKPILLATSIINALSYFLIFVSQSFWIIIAARVIAGIGSANISVAQAYIADTSASHERTKKMALIGAVFGLGFIIGPLLGGVVSEFFGVAIAFLIPAILCAVNSLLIVFFLTESNKSLQKEIKIKIFDFKVTREILRPPNMSFLLFLFFFINLALALVIGILPIFTKQRFGWGEAQNGYYFGLIGVGSFITQAFLVNRLLKRFNEAQMVRLALLVFGIAVIIIGLSPAGWLVYLIGPFTALGFSLVNIGLQSLISLESKPDEQGIVLGVSQSFASMARVVGPLAGGLIASLNVGLPYIISGAMAILILFWGQNKLKYMRGTIKTPKTEE